jgi:hypothetical protein
MPAVVQAGSKRPCRLGQGVPDIRRSDGDISELMHSLKQSLNRWYKSRDSGPRPKASSTSRNEAEGIASIVVNAIETNYVTDDRHLLVLVTHLHFSDFNLRVLSTNRS